MTTRPWQLWRRQALTVARFEARRILAGRRWIAIFLLAWSLFVVIFFSIPTEKRDLYVLPAFPAFALPNAAGETVRSADLLAKGPLVLTIFRGVW